ncbi:MAG TPA: energy transducer TonB [Candidatus Aquilonibacter sp.]|nr:energy transducer TonB [Candidatus Aquilonibacter sp.]
MSAHKMLALPPTPAHQRRLQAVPDPSPRSGEEKHDPFLDAMLDMPTTGRPRPRNPVKMVISLLIHAGIIALLIIVPVYFAKHTQVIPKALEQTFVFTPPPPAPPPPAATRAPQTSAPSHVTQGPTQPVFHTSPLMAPTEIPKNISMAANNAVAPDLNAGVAGGVLGGVLGGLLGGTGTATGPPAPPKSPAIVRVGGDVKPPQLVQRVQPEYPTVARLAHVQGTVVIDAVINKSGSVVSERAVSGPSLLVPAALDAVKQWKYQPTYLNGQPVNLAMQVTVDFQLGAG